MKDPNAELPGIRSAWLERPIDVERQLRHVAGSELGGGDRHGTSFVSFESAANDPTT